MLHREITTDRSLMFVQEQHIDRFYKVREKMGKYCYIIENEKVTPVDDAWILVFNIWMLIQPDKCRVIQSVEKLLYYSPNFYVLEALESDKNIQSLKKRSNGNEELTFLSALKITYEVWLWVLDVIDKFGLNDIVEKNKNLVYHDSHKRTKKEMKNYLRDQARLTKAFVKELNSTNSFQDMIKKSCHEAYSLYVEDFANKN